VIFGHGLERSNEVANRMPVDAAFDTPEDPSVGLSLRSPDLVEVLEVHPVVRNQHPARAGSVIQLIDIGNALCGATDLVNRDSVGATAT
jgi:hypothetical protein